MPKRSNDFQRLIAMLTQLSSGGAAVHESVEVLEIASGQRREVDVVALGDVAGHQTTVFIECRDWQRKQDVQWVEQARTKFDDLGANVKVLVSSSGFTKSALEKAARYGIKTITPGEITDEFVGRLVNSVSEIQYHHWVTLTLRAEVVITRDGVTQQQELPGNVPIWLADGSQASLLVDLVQQVTSAHTRTHGDEWDEMFRTGVEKYGEGKVKFIASGDGPDPVFNGQKVYLKGISSQSGEEELFEIVNVIVEFEAQRTVVDVAVTHGEYDGTYFSTGKSGVGEGNSLQIVCTENVDGGFDLMGRIDGTVESLGPLIGATMGAKSQPPVEAKESARIVE
jgi:hypothetical protein